MKKTLIIIGSIIGSLILINILGSVLIPTAKFVDVAIIHPEEISAGEEFTVTYQITNTSDKTRELHSIDLQKKFIDEVQVGDTSPDTVDRYNIPGWRSFEFLTPIQPAETLEVDFTMRAVAGAHLSQTDICIDGPARCTPEEISLFVSE